MKAVILAGGLGTRLRPLTNNKPKPMLPVGEKPILEHLIEWTKKGGIKSIVICVSYLKESIEEYFGDGSKFGVSIEYAISKKPLATAGQLKTAEQFIDDDFVCMYGDSIFNFSLRSMIKQHTTKKPMVTMSLNEYKTNLQYGVIETSKNGKVISWNEKPEIKANVNMGCYIMNPLIFDLIPKNKSYGMDDVIKKAMKKKQSVRSFVTKKGFTDIGKVISWNEKPEIKANVNMGCYIMNPLIFDLIPKNKSYGMDDVIKKAMKKKQLVRSFVTKKGFTDIGNKESYMQACKEYEQKQKRVSK